MKKIKKLLFKNKSIFLLILLLFLIVTFRLIQQNKIFSFKIRADDKVVIVDGKCDASMCPGRKTSDGKQVCVSVGFISMLGEKCYECFGPNQGKRSNLSIAHWEVTDIGKCSKTPSVTVSPTVPPLCPICPTCGAPPGTGTPTPSTQPTTPTPTNPTGPTLTPNPLKKAKVIYSNKSQYDIEVEEVFTYSSPSLGGNRTIKENKVENKILQSGKSFEENFSVACEPYFGILAHCINNSRGDASDSLVIDDYCLTEDETFHVDINDNNSSCTKITPTPTKTPTPTLTPTRTPTPTPTPTIQADSCSGFCLLNICDNYGLKRGEGKCANGLFCCK